MVKEYIEEKECRKLNQEFSENLKDYQNRSANLTDEDWLIELIMRKCSHITREQAEKEALEILRMFANMICHLWRMLADREFHPNIGWNKKSRNQQSD